VKILVCPGQGSQQSEVSDTAIVQPLIVSESLASYAHSELLPTMVAGHSVGMLPAFAIAGCYSFETAISLARTRGKLFHDVAALTDSGMSAVIGKNVLPIFESLDTPLDVAVVNSDSQIVVAGSKKALADLALNVPRGLRVTPLKVSGAFHTEAMWPVVEPFAEVLSTLEFADPKIPVLSDLTGELITGGVAEHLIAQITNPVRWDLVTSQLGKLACEPDDSDLEIVELAPSGTLTALLKRALPKVHITALP
jgi:[acyl-carrier-protein] S-malonyltransferase